MNKGQSEVAIKSTLSGATVSILAVWACFEVTSSEPNQFWMLSILGSIAIAMELIALESSRTGIRFTFSLPYIAAITIAIGDRQGLFVETLMVAMGTLLAIWTQKKCNIWTVVWNQAIGLSAFLFGVIAYHWVRFHFGETPFASVEIIVFMAGYIIIDLAGLAFLQGVPNLSTLSLTVGDSAWLAASMVGFYILIGIFAASIVYRGSGWLLPVTTIPGLALRAGIAYRVRMVENYDDTIAALALMLQRAHPFTHDHMDRVSETAEVVARKLGLGRRQAKLVKTAAILHDIGKIAVDESILDKPAKLTDAEYEHVKLHAEIGASILQPVKELYEIAEWVRYHHERPDGKGYPAGLTSVEIPIQSKIIAVVDAFDAMTGSGDPNGVRPYREAMSSEEAMRELRRCSGTQFDEVVVTAFCHAYDENRREAPQLKNPNLGDVFAQS